MKNNCWGCRAVFVKGGNDEDSRSGDWACSLGYKTKPFKLDPLSFRATGPRYDYIKPAEECPKPRTWEQLTLAEKLRNKAKRQAKKKAVEKDRAKRRKAGLI